MVPEFTVKLISSLPEANKSIIELTIKNQPFDRNSTYAFFLNVRTKTSDGNWREIYTPEDGYPTQPSSNYTVLSFSSSNEYDGYFIATTYPYSHIITPPNAKADFQLQAMIGSRHRGTYSAGIMPYVFEGEKSSWTNTQTLAIPETSTSISSSLLQHPTNTVVEPPKTEPIPTMLIGAVSVAAVALVAAGLLVYHKRKAKC